MKKRLCIIICWLMACCFSSLSQEIFEIEEEPLDINNAFQAIRTDIDSLRYFNALEKLKNNKKLYTTDVYHENIYYQALATAYYFNQMPEEAIRSINQGSFRNISNQSKIEGLSAFRSMDAKKYIIQCAKKERIVVFNGEPYSSEHSVFLKSLLPDFYNSGFRYLAIESLNELFSNEWNQYNTTLNINFLPAINANWGYYCKEACMSELIREAIRLGFQLWSYKSLLVNKDKSENELMADKLSELINSYGNEDTRVIVFGYYGSWSKKDNNSFYNCLRNKTGIIPLTINQTEYMEQSAEIYEKREYTEVVKRSDIENPVVLLDSSGNCFQKDFNDIFVFHPRKKKIYNRSSFLLENGQRKPVIISKIKQPVVVKAYHANELGKGNKQSSTTKIPVDLINIEYPEKNQGYYLFLPQGIFLIQYQDLSGKIINEYYKEVKL